jgi:CHAT domain-containing protein/Tfp pilus assembly protein PilF
MTTALSLAVRGPLTHAQTPDDTALLRAATQTFFAAYQRKDVEGLLGLWSTKSPELPAFEAEVRQTFSLIGGIELKEVAFRRVSAEGAQAVVRVAIEMHAAEVKTGRPAAGLGKSHRTLRFVKEDGRWKLWAYAESEVELAQALASAEKDGEQAALLEAEPELQTQTLSRALLRQGELSGRQGDLPRALRALGLSRAVAERLGDKAGAAAALNNLALISYAQRDYPRALDYFERSLSLTAASDDKAATARTLNNIAIVRRSLGDYARALEALHRSLKLAEESGDKTILIAVLNSIGAVYREQGDYARALEFFQRSLPLGEALGDKAAIFQAINNIGTIYVAQGNHAQALEHFQRSLAFGEASGDKSLTAYALHNLGLTYYSQKDYLRALDYYQKSLAEREALGDKRMAALTLNNIATIHGAQGNHVQALEYFRRSLALSEALGDKAAMANALNNIGTIRRFLGDYARALEDSRRSVSLAEESGDKKLLSEALNIVGAVYREQGDYARALEFFQRSLALRETLGSKELLGPSLNNIGTIHGAQGNHAQALEYFRRSLALGEASGDKAMAAHALNNLGITYYSQKDYERALEYYQKSLALREALGDQQMAALTLNNIGVVHRERGDYPRALEYYRKSLALREQLGDQAGTAAALNHIGIIHHLQADHTRALEIAARVGDLATRLASPELLWRAHELAGRANRALGRPDEARRAFSDSIETIEKMRHRVGGGELARQRFFEDKLPPYLAMVDLLVSLGLPGEALAYAERAKARALLDVLRNGRVPVTKTMTAEEREQERASNAELATLNAQIHDEGQRLQPDRARMAELERLREKARLAHESFLTGLYVKHPELKVQRGEAAPVTAASVAELLPGAETALLEFVVAEEKSYLLVLTRAGRKNVAGPVEIRVYPLAVTAGQLSERVRAFRDMLARRDQGYRESARQLYDLLLKPAEGQLAGKKTLCVVPDQALWELPFQALQPRPGAHLVEDYALFYAPSLSVLREAVKKRAASTPGGARAGARPSAKTLLALGNPLLTGETVVRVQAIHRDEPLGPLPEAEREVKTLSRLYGAANSRVFVGAEASEGRVKAEAPNYAILHFATHGLLDDRNPMYSQLTLARAAGDPHEDGLLEAREIINLDLRAELAVLSACQMAGGRVGAGEGMIGMSWALFVAGVPTTVASQWKVESSSTTSLMIDFHRRLTARGFPARAPGSKAEALRQAALRLSRDERYKHPFYWAGFVMVGDGW